GQRLGEIVRVGVAIGDQHLLDTGEFGRSLGCFPGTAATAGYQHVHLAAQLARGGQRLVGRVLEVFMLVLGNQKRGDHRIPVSYLSFETSSVTSLTLTPPLRPGGS